MPKFVIERTLPAPATSPPATSRPSRRSRWRCSTPWRGGPSGESYVTDDKLFCVYIADDADTVAEHAEAGGFPCDAARVVHTMIDPTTAEAVPA